MEATSWVQLSTLILNSANFSSTLPFSVRVLSFSKSIRNGKNKCRRKSRKKATRNLFSPSLKKSAVLCHLIVLGEPNSSVICIISSVNNFKSPAFEQYSACFRVGTIPGSAMICSQSAFAKFLKQVLVFVACEPF